MSSVVKRITGYAPATKIRGVVLLGALILVTTIGCSGSPEVVYVDREIIREVPVEVVVEKEVIREVVVTATPAPTSMAPVTPTGTAPATATPLPGLNITQSISVGTLHTCGLREDGEAVCWGINSSGQSSPPGGRFIAIVAGALHTCGLREDGEAVCWGINSSGQSNSGGRRYAAIAAGGHHTCGLRASGSVECWGWNNFGQLYSPDGVFTAISADHGHTCGLRASGSVECWGWNKYGQSSNMRGEGIVAISTGPRQSCGLRQNGTGLCWGGKGSSDVDVDVVQLDGPFKAIATGTDYVCALRDSGEAVCWGSNSEGQTAPPSGIRFTAISAGDRHTCALRDSGEAVCWGWNEYGQVTPPPGRFALPRTGPSVESLPTDSSFDTASVLARFSTPDPAVGEARSAAVGEIVSIHTQGDRNTERVLDLLHTIAPELSIEERRQAADELGRISADGTWDAADTEEGVLNLATLITGSDPNPRERIHAASDLVEKYEAGELDPDTGLDLMNTIAPGLSINERRQSASALAVLSADDDWDDADRMAAASEVFRLVTGVPLDAEQRMGATVDLAGVGVKIFDTDDSYSDREIDVATQIIKQSLTGNLTSESLENILGQ